MKYINSKLVLKLVKTEKCYFIWRLQRYQWS